MRVMPLNCSQTVLADSLQAIADAVADNNAADAELTTAKEPEKAGKGGKAATMRFASSRSSCSIGAIRENRFRASASCHSFVDGIHVGRLVEKLQDYLNKC